MLPQAVAGGSANSSAPQGPIHAAVALRTAPPVASAATILSPRPGSSLKNSSEATKSLFIRSRISLRASSV
jgi:hypothetical protein